MKSPYLKTSLFVPFHSSILPDHHSLQLNHSLITDILTTATIFSFPSHHHNLTLYFPSIQLFNQHSLITKILPLKSFSASHHLTQESSYHLPQVRASSPRSVGASASCSTPKHLVQNLGRHLFSG